MPAPVVAFLATGLKFVWAKAIVFFHLVAVWKILIVTFISGLILGFFFGLTEVPITWLVAAVLSTFWLAPVLYHFARRNPRLAMVFGPPGILISGAFVVAMWLGTFIRSALIT